ncbi:carbohydrate kinase family protein [Pedobacter sp.]|uniref:carbohydrate kinase family protein n=1 Tax=Pedobacter sp. TaxID=1411316 RepID=UPI003D7F2C01
MKLDLIAIADLCIDILIDAQVKPAYGQVEQLADQYAIDLGGSVGIFASQIAKLGGSIGVISKIGDDPQGRIILESLEKAGVDLSLVEIIPDEQTPMGLNLSCKGDRAMLTYLGTLKLIEPSVFTPLLVDRASHWHIGSYFLLNNLIPYWPGWIKTLKEAGVTVSLDTNWDPDGDWTRVQEILPLIDVFLPNEAEALAISGKANLLEAGQFLSTQCPLVVIKRGGEGALLFAENEVIDFKIPADLLVNLNIVDTTGAGDNFDAGFIFEWLAGQDYNTCLYRGVQCGTESLKALGGVKSQILLNRI